MRRGIIALTAVLGLAAAASAEWPHWRGPARDGTSPEAGLVTGWSLADGTNLLWKVDGFVGRSTPVVIDGLVCANGRGGESSTREELVACFDAATGERKWERRFGIYHTSVPWTRVGWANLAADPETGFLYVQGVGGLFFCLEAATGEIVWSKNLVEEFGFMEGYGGRTQTPLVDEDRVVVSFSNTSWGSEGRPLHRYRAFDKRTGEQLWVSQPGPSQADKNTQSTPNVMVVDGRRLVVAGNGSGAIYGVEARTGEPVWGFSLSKRGINTSVVVDGTTVFASHSEENVDGDLTMGRVVAIDGSGSGDVTATHERWRAPIAAGYSSPALADGRLYVLDNGANLHALDAKTGEEAWTLDVGRVGKASPVVADGRLYVTEVNGRFVVVELGESAGRILDLEEIPIPAEERFAEIYGSPAVAYGRIYFTTEEGIYCLGDPERPFEAVASEPVVPADPPAPDDAVAARLRVVPGDLWTGVDEPVVLEVRAFDGKGRSLGAASATWSLDGLVGTVEDGRFTPDPDAGSQAGLVVATVGELSASARIRVLSGLPLEEDFESWPVGSRPDYQLAYLSRFAVAELEGVGKVLAKGPSPVKIHRHITFLGRPDLSAYTIEADLMGTREGRRVPDVGLINSGYTMELLGGYQRIQVRSWQAGLRIATEVDFPWEMGVWYRMKLRVEPGPASAIVRGKVWPRSEPEPEAWAITVEDPRPIRAGSPGLSGFSPATIYFDNVTVTSNS